MPCYVCGNIFGISDYSTEITSPPAKKLLQWQSSTIKQMFWRDFFFFISCCLSRRPRFQYRNKLLTVIRDVGATSEKYLFLKNLRYFQQNQCWVNVQSMCSLTGHHFRKKVQPATKLKKCRVTCVFLGIVTMFSEYLILRTADFDYRNY